MVLESRGPSVFDTVRGARSQLMPGKNVPLQPVRAGLIVAVAGAAAIFGLASLAEESEAAIINNGVVQLGVDLYGQLNACCGTPSSGSGTSTVGIRYMPTNADATSPGCV